MDRKVVDGLVALPERNRYTRGLRAWLGFRQTDVRFDRPDRAAGETKYTATSLVRLATDGILSFSDAPLRLATWLGLLVSGASFLLALYFIILKLRNDIPIEGWASTVVIVLVLGGIQLLTIGVIGEYLARVYDEVKQRPLYVVSSLDNPAHETTST
jgi:dolichol-phosphate mannosyltransferase